MTAGYAHTDRDRAWLAAVRRFPQAEFSIRRLMNHSETFRDICEELAEAEVALATVPETPREICEARRREWQELVDRLVAEIAAWLARATHEPAGRGRSGQRENKGG